VAEARKLQASVRAVLRRAPPLSVRDLALDGTAVGEILGIGPGPLVGEALRYLLGRVLERPEENLPERLRAALHGWPAGTPPRV
jgi:tRNA nucleotidyltransferase (CCA-adding enzyme)